MSKSAFEHTVSLTFKTTEQTQEGTLSLETLKGLFKALPSAKVKSYNPRTGKLAFSYDASILTIEDCLNALTMVGLEVDRSNFIKRWHFSLATMKDENIRANAKHVPHCCSKAPNVRR